MVNLTPHEITIVLASGGILSIPPSGELARVSENKQTLGMVDNIPVIAIEYGQVEGLPDPVDGTVYLVSGMVLDLVPERHDVFAPALPVRNPEGRIVGCEALRGNK